MDVASIIVAVALAAATIWSVYAIARKKKRGNLLEDCLDGELAESDVRE